MNDAAQWAGGILKFVRKGEIMRCTRVLLFASLSFPVLGQTPDAGQPVLQSLLAEVQQLRIAIERSTLVGMRTRLALNRLQYQANRAGQLTQALDGLRKEIAGLAVDSKHMEGEAKDFEDKLSSATNPQERKDLEGAVKERKLNLERIASLEQERNTREAELNQKLLSVEAEMAESQRWVAEMERSLDAAIQQTSKQH